MKTSFFSILAAITIMLGCMFNISSMSASAASPNSTDKGLSETEIQKPEAVTDFKVILTCSNAVRLSWNKSADAQGYILYKHNGTSWERIAVTAENIYTVKELTPATSYKFAIKAYKKVDSLVIANSGLPQTSATTNPATVTGFKAAETTLNTAKLTWNNAKGANGYILYKQVNGAWVEFKKLSGTSFTFSGLTKGSVYKYAVRAYATVNGNTILSANPAITTAVTKLDTVKNFKADSIALNEIALSWDKVDKAASYVLYQLKDGKWQIIARPTSTSYTVKGLGSTTTFRFAVRPYTKVDGYTVTSASYPNLLTCTLPAKVTGFRAASVNGTSITLAWNRTAGANGYIVYRYNPDNKKWVRMIKTATNVTSYTATNLSSKTAYKFAIKAYKTINGKEITDTVFPVLNVKTANKIVTINGVTYVEGVLVANKTYSLPASYDPGGLTSETQAAFSRMQSAAARDGLSLWISSGYRSYSYQSYLYNSYVARDGKAAADRYSARPGHSEHQTGLAIDVNNPSSSFDNTAEARWLAKNCANYGFILRYPKGKESITGYKYESWHVRYVGVDLAKKITASGLTLEEYFGITSRYSY